MDVSVKADELAFLLDVHMDTGLTLEDVMSDVKLSPEHEAEVKRLLVARLKRKRGGAA